MLPAEGHSNDRGRAGPADQCDAVVLATAEVSAALAPRTPTEARSWWISGAFRLQEPADYAKWYGFDTPRPSGCPGALRSSGALRPAAEGGARGEPRCYPTAVSSRSRRKSERGSWTPRGRGGRKVGRDGRAARPGALPRSPKSTRTCARTSCSSTSTLRRSQGTWADRSRRIRSELTFTAHLLPVKRGPRHLLRETAAGATTEAVIACPMTRTTKVVRRRTRPGRRHAKAVVFDEPRDRGGEGQRGNVIVVCALDNLVKGAGLPCRTQPHVRFAETQGLVPQRVSP